MDLIKFDTNNFTLTDQLLGPLFRDSPVVPRMRVLGPLIIPLPINIFLLAIISCQVVEYGRSTRRQTDHWGTKALVGIIGLSSVATSTALMLWTYDICIASFGRPHALFRTDLMASLVSFVTSESLAIHGFYGYKAYHLYNRAWWVAGVIGSLSVAMAVGSMLDVVAITTEKSLIAAAAKPLTIIASRLIIWVGIACDLAITSLIMFKLLRSRTGWSATDALVERIARLFFESQTPPTALTTLVAVHRVASGTTLLSIPAVIILGSAYAIGIMWSLNHRTHISNRDRSTDNVFRSSAPSSTKRAEVKDDTYVEHATSAPDHGMAPRTRHSGPQAELEEDRAGRENVVLPY